MSKKRGKKSVWAVREDNDAFTSFHVVIKKCFFFFFSFYVVSKSLKFRHDQARPSLKSTVWDSSTHFTLIHVYSRNQIIHHAVSEERLFQHQTDAIHLWSEKTLFPPLSIHTFRKKKKKIIIKKRGGSIRNVIADDGFLVHVSSNFAAGKLRYILSTGLHAAANDDGKGEPETTFIPTN